MAMQSHIDRRPDGAAILYGTTPPAVSGDGTYQAGDTMINTAAGNTGPIGWRCATGGSPGTWSAMGMTSEPIVIGPMSAAAAVSFSFPVDQNYQISSVTLAFTTASTSGTMQIERLTGTQAAGAGVVQLTGTMSLAGAANTVVTGTIITTPSTFTAGADRIGLLFAGTMTNLVGLMVNIVVVRAT